MEKHFFQTPLAAVRGSEGPDRDLQEGPGVESGDHVVEEDAQAAPDAPVDQARGPGLQDVEGAKEEEGEEEPLPGGWDSGHGRQEAHHLVDDHLRRVAPAEDRLTDARRPDSCGEEDQGRAEDHPGPLASEPPGQRERREDRPHRPRSKRRIPRPQVQVSRSTMGQYPREKPGLFMLSVGETASWIGVAPL